MDFFCGSKFPKWGHRFACCVECAPRASPLNFQGLFYLSISFIPSLVSYPVFLFNQLMWVASLAILRQSCWCVGTRLELISPSSVAMLPWTPSGENPGCLGRNTPDWSGKPSESATPSYHIFILCSTMSTCLLTLSWGKKGILYLGTPTTYQQISSDKELERENKSYVFTQVSTSSTACYAGCCLLGMGCCLFCMGCCLLCTGCCLLCTGCCLLCAGCWLLCTECCLLFRVLPVVHRVLPVVRDAGWLLCTGCCLLNMVCCRLFQGAACCAQGAGCWTHRSCWLDPLWLEYWYLLRDGNVKNKEMSLQINNFNIYV